MLGCHFDVKLTMNVAIDKIISKIRPKIQAMTRTIGVYSPGDMLQQFKTHIWGYTEYTNGAIMHATETNLHRLDNLQKGFLRNLDISAEDAFVNHNFAPTNLRRDIGILGFIHKRILEKCHPLLLELMPRRDADQFDSHSKQIYVGVDHIFKFHSLFHRSVFGKIFIYNRLTQSLINEDSVSGFQRRLTLIAKARCAAGDPNWSRCFHDIECLQPHRLTEQT